MKEGKGQFVKSLLVLSGIFTYTTRRIWFRYLQSVVQYPLSMSTNPSVDKGIVIFRLEDSRIAEGWVNLDVLGLLQQVGIIPMPG